MILWYYEIYGIFYESDVRKSVEFRNPNGNLDHSYWNLMVLFTVVMFPMGQYTFTNKMDSKYNAIQLTILPARFNWNKGMN